MLNRSSKDAARRPEGSLSSGWRHARQWLSRLLGRGLSRSLLRDKRRTGLAVRAAARAGGRAHSRARTAPKARLTAAELAVVRRDLQSVLDHHSQARQVLPYLRVLERGLWRRGGRALDLLPTELLRRALRQLDLLVTERHLLGLTILRSKAALSVARRSGAERPGRAPTRARQPAGASDPAQVRPAPVRSLNAVWGRPLSGVPEPMPLPARSGPPSTGNSK